ncbi:hypothetical protein CAE01nite_16600 [Cellulomonas aerilata]|uniref:Uncharacterized protein n=1 Tax=Cellulomonas aerilata TaxID=515326 RepID=A0A512DBW1_9CELL|nr:hypothetical protein CAE01nite_16600 [Cellulomonas aerilata]
MALSTHEAVDASPWADVARPTAPADERREVGVFALLEEVPEPIHVTAPGTTSSERTTDAFSRTGTQARAVYRRAFMTHSPATSGMRTANASRGILRHDSDMARTRAPRRMPSLRTVGGRMPVAACAALSCRL